MSKHIEEAAARNFFRKWYWITNAVTEGLNSKIQQMRSVARGFRNFENYKIAILFYCGKLDMYPQKTL